VNCLLGNESVSDEDKVLLKKENGVAWITLNRPTVLNACDIGMLKRLQQVIKSIDQDKDARCVVITGAGRAFCAGADLQSLQSRGAGSSLSFAEDLKEGFNPVLLGIRRIERPVIAMVNGVAAGAGMGLAFACDLRIMSESAKFVEAFAKVGLVPDSAATFFMPRLLGIAKAMELAFTGEGIDAKEAERLGAVNAVVKPEDLLSKTRELAEKLAKGPKGMGLAKRAINKALYSDVETTLDYEADLQEIAGATEDHKEGVKAFLEKRQPQFQGK
jgi:2-(1,2-epoxy-1,2-dihydrophenyl)acetyl-CoA isomerase